MKTHLLLLFLFVFTMSGDGQNLVPNYSFELNSGCPDGQDQIYLVDNWFKCSEEKFTTPDYYNSCAPLDGFGIPQSLLQYHEEFRGCDAYLGLYSSSNVTNYREFVGVELNSQLEVGQKYYVSFRTVGGNLQLAEEFFNYSTNNLGVKFTQEQYSPSTPAPLNNQAHLYSSEVITDYENWQRISGSFVSDSSYSYLLIGNFFDDDNTEVVLSECDGCLNGNAYYLIDDVCVSTDSLFCNSIIDNLPCATDVGDVISEKILIHPNPTSGRITVDVPKQRTPVLFFVYSSQGDRIFEQRILPNESQLEIDVSSWPSGLYYVSSPDLNLNARFIRR